MALSPTVGLSVSSTASLIVKKTLFASLELPYSINWGETVTVVPVIFNFHNDSATIRVTITLHEELQLLDPLPSSQLEVCNC